MIECLWCKKEFNPPLREVKRGNGKFCCRACSTKYRVANLVPPPLNTECAWCQKRFYKTALKKSYNKSGLSFCCRKCKDTAQKIGGIEAIQPSHYGSVETKSDYREIAFNYYPNSCSVCNWNSHISVLQVHHKDRNRKNNRVENLIILCPTCHQVEHYLSNDGLYNRVNWNSESSSS